MAKRTSKKKPAPVPAVQKTVPPAPEVRRPVGRPTKYEPQFPEDLIRHMAGGLSYEAFAGRIGVHLDTLYDWEKAHPEFLEAKKVAVARGQYFWEQLGLASSRGTPMVIGKDEDGNPIRFNPKNFNTAVWIFTMKNRFRWRDRVEHSGDEDKPIRVIVEEYGGNPNLPNPKAD